MVKVDKMFIFVVYGDDDGSAPDPLKMHHTCGGATFGRTCERCAAERKRLLEDDSEMAALDGAGR